MLPARQQGTFLTRGNQTQLGKESRKQGERGCSSSSSFEQRGGTRSELIQGILTEANMMFHMYNYCRRLEDFETPKIFAYHTWFKKKLNKIDTLIHHNNNIFRTLTITIDILNVPKLTLSSRFHIIIQAHCYVTYQIFYCTYRDQYVLYALIHQNTCPSNRMSLRGEQSE